MGPGHWMSHRPHCCATKTLHHLNSNNKVLLLLPLHPHFSKGLPLSPTGPQVRKGAIIFDSFLSHLRQQISYQISSAS